MFKNKPYYEVNREERFYCFLLGHALLSSRKTCELFFKLISEKCNHKLNPEDFEFYLEIAALRDYWNDLGDSKKYLDETHQKRLSILVEIIKNQIPDSPVSPEAIIEGNDFFWTKGNPRKLWNPGHWNLKEIDSSDYKNLREVKWAFNAKPDILVISGSNCLFIEAKIESGIGQYGEGNNQLDTQETIAHLMKLLIPTFNDKEFKNTLLTKSGNDGIFWKEVLETLVENEIDEFSWKCFKKVK